MNMHRHPFLKNPIPALTATAFLLVLLNLAGLAAKFHWNVAPDHGWVALFDLDRERNVPSVFSTGLILYCAALLALMGRGTPGKNRLAWLGLACIFAFLALDELVSLHERLIEPVRAGLHASGIFYFAWLIPYGLAVVLLGLAYLRFLMGLPHSLRRTLIVSATVYLSGAVGLELLGGAYLESLHDAHNLPYELLTTLEESLEMAGMIGLARGLLRWERALARGDRGLRAAPTMTYLGRVNSFTEPAPSPRHKFPSAPGY
ncbi:hypothetical protein [Methylococcus sp. EFPC2]|uniref:hypothetical protein n=1 Tax=Methylococcus sp. EFPC2 TaxID=2812648 RepID=UPI0019674C4F|nr:hypothetical protein [Methylococcus sp. EFPC2]QSA98587.1 hypothetical protein JWZ97_07265 [Methylococcus sp. EFPC2]